jgi:hypothetical protein
MLGVVMILVVVLVGGWVAVGGGGVGRTGSVKGVR